MYRLPGKDKYFIMVTTATKLYQFRGSVTDDKPVLQQVFKTYLSIPEKFESVPTVNHFKSKLDFYHSNIKEVPKRFAWLTGNGIYYANVSFSLVTNFVTINCYLSQFYFS